MINEIFLMNGYGIYVWSAFSFTVISFGSLFFITKLQFLKERRKFVQKFGLLNDEAIRVAKSQKLNKQILEGVLSSKI